MKSSVNDVIAQSDAAIRGLGHASSTLRQYRWAWNRFAVFCAEKAAPEFSEEVVVLYIEAVATEYREGRITQWKYNVFRKAVLVLAEVARTGSYQWKLSRSWHPNDSLNLVFRPVQEHFETWLGCRNAASLTLGSCLGPMSRQQSFS